MYLKFSLAVCVRVLYSCFCASSQAQKRILGTKEQEECAGCTRSPTSVAFFCFTCVTSFLSKCGYKGGERNEKSKRFCCSEVSRVPKDGELDVFKITIKAATSA